MINAEVLLFLVAYFPLEHSQAERNETKVVVGLNILLSHSTMVL